MGPTQEDVARRAKVSRALVSLVMRDAPNVSPSSRRKVLRAAQELGYRPNAFARSLASKRVRTLGVLVNDVANPYFGGLYASLAKAAFRAGYDILTAPGIGVPRSEPALVETLLEHRVAGLVLLSPLMRTSDLRRASMTRPTVVVGREVTIADVDVVTADEVQAARCVVARLTELGHRKIAHINGGRNRPATDRAAAYRLAVEEAGLDAMEFSGAFTQSGGKHGARALLDVDGMPTALIAANDLCALGAIGLFQAHGLRVPEDISVVGYDDSQIAQLDLVQLTSVRQPIDKFARVAVSTLVARIEDPARPRSVQRLGTVLVERHSVGPATTGNRHLARVRRSAGTPG